MYVKTSKFIWIKPTIHCSNEIHINKHWHLTNRKIRFSVKKVHILQYRHTIKNGITIKCGEEIQTMIIHTAVRQLSWSFEATILLEYLSTRYSTVWYCILHDISKCRNWIIPRTHISHRMTQPRITVIGLSLVSLVRRRYNAVNIHKIINKRHPIARPLGRGMGCLLWISIWLIFCLSSCKHYFSTLLCWPAL